jgi:flagellar hook assembly protein FlgD
VDLLIQTVSGQTVLVRNGISAEWQWDGRNDDGHMVAPGVYFWYIRGSSESGKIVVKP